MPTHAPSVRLVTPAVGDVADYLDALRRRWSPDNIRGAAVARVQIAAILRDAPGFVAALDDPEAKGPPIQRPDGSQTARLPGFVRWIYQDGFCGSIGLRWQHGTSALPSAVLGHIGYGIVPWKRGRGIARQALALILIEAERVGLAFVEIVTQTDNLPSQRVVLACGGVLLGQFRKDPAYGGGEALRFRINLLP